jgi:hypothetical protein
VDAKFLLALFDAVFLVAVAVWLGAIVYLTVVLPGAFETLHADRNRCQEARRALLYRHYMLLTYCAAISLAALVCGRLTHNELRGPLTIVFALMAIASILLSTYGYHSVSKGAATAPGADSPSVEQAFQLDQSDWVINAVSLLLGLGLVISHATRPSPLSSGILEPTPLERRDRELKALEKRKARLDEYLRTHQPPSVSP